MEIRTALNGREFTLDWDTFVTRFLNRTTTDTVEILDIRVPKTHVIPQRVNTDSKTSHLRVGSAH